MLLSQGCPRLALIYAYVILGIRALPSAKTPAGGERCPSWGCHEMLPRADEGLPRERLRRLLTPATTSYLLGILEPSRRCAKCLDSTREKGPHTLLITPHMNPPIIERTRRDPPRRPVSSKKSSICQRKYQSGVVITDVRIKIVISKLLYIDKHMTRKEVLEMFMEELDREHKDYDKIVALHLSIDSE